ncbi:hypothetical protein H696_05283 [Fonticula alba]|uniref:Uncharacterized protein n=1 Tax=Fonticula alba TaxID=691883 RepID=A0A058Z4B8_FONAL|nr:hypothetical protein H696_05283 [Fonticula alba]KCV68367.1 hypothetical protein H696_05283 [Fonticula alba]|eukprot:XP_009497421.1 hypothetical protein H696_05283 [Fonticula alba]
MPISIPATLFQSDPAIIEFIAFHFSQRAQTGSSASGISESPVVAVLDSCRILIRPGSEQLVHQVVQDFINSNTHTDEADLPPGEDK